MDPVSKLLKNMKARIKAKDNATNNNPTKSVNGDSSIKTATTTKNKSTSSSSSSNNNTTYKNTMHSNDDKEDDKDSYSTQDLLVREVSLKEISNADDRKAQFIKKLKLCHIIFDFSIHHDLGEIDEIAKETKGRYLEELVGYISQSKHWFSEDDVVAVILSMIGTNLFRSLPPPIYQDFDPEEDEPNFDPSWPHLQFVYEFFHRFVMTADVKTIRRYINKRFLLNMIDLFNSQDPRERDYVKMILHRIYGRCMPFRSFIRNAINNILYPVIYLNLRHNGISELLEILGSIINGFALPLKEEHVMFLLNVLIPMHKVPFLSQFHAQLTYCITQFIQKDACLASSVIGGMLKFWPNISCQKELLYLNELEEVLELTRNEELEKIIEPLFCRISESICSTHFQVAERALFLWNNDVIATFTTDHRKKIFPIIYPGLQKNYSKHWNATVSSLTLNIIRIFKEMDKDLYEEVAKNYIKRKEILSINKQKRETKWKIML